MAPAGDKRTTVFLLRFLWQTGWHTTKRSNRDGAVRDTRVWTHRRVSATNVRGWITSGKTAQCADIMHREKRRIGNHPSVPTRNVSEYILSMKAAAGGKRTKGSAGEAHYVHKAMSQVESNCSPPVPRVKQNEGMSGRTICLCDPAGHERVSCGKTGRNRR